MPDHVEPLKADDDITDPVQRVYNLLGKIAARSVTTTQFEKFEKHFDDFVEKVYTPDHGEMVKRLDAIEKLLWQGQRLEQLAQRVLALAEATGHHELAQPFIASPGMAEPVKS